MNKKRRGEYMNRNRIGIREYLTIFVCLLIGAALISVAFFMDNSEYSDKTHSETSDYEIIDLQSKEESTESEENGTSENTSEDNYDIITVETKEYQRGELILVNKEHYYSFREDDVFLKVYDLKTNKYKIGTGTETLSEKTIEKANSFLGDFYDLSGKTNITMVNGYISEQEQLLKYEKYIKSVSPEEAQKWGVKAGASDHHTGLSFNLTLYPSGGKIGEGDYAWLTENAHQYGFILRYPQEKSDITKVKDDNHFRYVGVPHAEYIYKNSLTLDEYIVSLENTSFSSPLVIESGNTEYVVYHSPADKTSETTEIKIPEGYKYSVSGNNVDGFIVTAYK